MHETNRTRWVLDATKEFAKASDLRASFQVTTTLAALVATLFLARAVALPISPVLLPLLAGLVIRIFVLQHDCGHKSLFAGGRVNDLCGLLLSFVTGVPYDAWRTEHNWHHANQGKLSHRGVDMMNSPLTVEEAAADPARARQRQEKTTLRNVLVVGAWSLLVERKHWRAFFQFRPSFRWPVGGRARIIRGLLATLAGHLLWNLIIFRILGLAGWAAVFVPSMFAAAAIGSYLFWIQHNFEHSWHADDERWTFASVGLEGSSYLRLGRTLRWFTADIGLHHVHHLNSRIPNYRLEAARIAIPALAAIRPLSAEDRRRSFTHIFWDARARRMVPPAERLASPR